MALGFDALGTTPLGDIGDGVADDTKQTRTIVTAGYTGGHVRTLSATATAVEIDAVSSTGASLSIDNTGLVTSSDDVTQTQDYEYRIFDGTWGDYLSDTVFIATELDEKTWEFTGVSRSTYDSNDTVGPPPSSSDLEYTAAGPYLHATPNLVTMRRTPQDTDRDEVVVLSNTGSQSIDVNSVSLAGDVTNYSVEVDPTPATLAPGDTLNFTFRFSPTAGTSTVPAEATATIVCSDTDHNQEIVICGSKGAEPGSYISITSGTTLPLTIDTADTNFKLESNISAATNAILVGGATNMTLDLNGYTIEYNTSFATNSNGVRFLLSGSIIRHFFEITDTSLAGTGKIVQATGDTSLDSHAIEFILDSRRMYTFINNIAIENNGTDAHAITSRASQGTSKTICDNVTIDSSCGVTTNRHSLKGYRIHFDASLTGGAYNIFKNLTVRGTPQGGITDPGQYSQFYDNDIDHVAISTNGFGIRMAGESQRCFGNTIGTGSNDQSGRGIMFSAAAQQRAFNNTVDIRQDRPEDGGGNNLSYGIQMDGDGGLSTNNRAYSNTITVTANSTGGVEYGAHPIRVTNISSAAGIIFHDNNVNVALDGSAAPLYASCISINSGSGGLFAYNTYTTDKDFIDGWWDGWDGASILGGSLSPGLNQRSVGINSTDSQFVHCYMELDTFTNTVIDSVNIDNMSASFDEVAYFRPGAPLDTDCEYTISLNGTPVKRVYHLTAGVNDSDVEYF